MGACDHESKNKISKEKTSMRLKLLDFNTVLKWFNA